MARINVAIVADAKQFQQATKDVNNTLGGMGDTFKKWNKRAVMASTAVMVAVGKVAKDSRIRGQELKSSLALADVAYGDQMDRVKAWAETVKRSSGMSSQAVIAATTDSQDMLVGFGMAADKAADLTMGNWELAQALAATSGGALTTEEAFDRLTKGTLGQTEGLKALGTVIDAQMIKERLKAKGLGHLTGMELKQAQAIAIQELALEQNQHKVDAWNSGNKEAMENQNGLASSVMQLKDNLAMALIPAFDALDKILGKVGSMMEDNQKGIAILVGVIVGLAATVLAVNAAYKVFIATKRIIIGLTKAWAVAQKLLNAVMNANPIARVIMIVTGFIAVVVAAYKNVEWFRKIVDGAWKGIQRAIKTVTDWWTRTAWPAIKRAYDAFGRAVTQVRTTVRNAFNGIRNVIGNVTSFVSGKVEGMRNRVVGAINGIKSVLSGMWNGVTAGARAAVNGAIGLLNGAINGLNKLVSGANKVPGVNIPLIPNIPRLHTGGVFRSGPGSTEGLALLRDGERVLRPDQDAPGGDTVVKVYIDGREFKGMIRSEISESNRKLRRKAGARI